MSLSARAIGLAANTPCPRLDTLAAAGHSDTATAAALGYENKSPRLAYAVGIAFENRVTTDHLALAELLGADEGQVLNIEADHGSPETYIQTLDALNNPETAIILQGVIPGPLGGWLRPDILYRRGGIWETGEIKVYLDKDTETSPKSFGQALTQAAISTRALNYAKISMGSYVSVILSHLNGAPTVRRVTVNGEIERIEQLLERVKATGQGSTLAPFAPQGDHIYSIRCVGTCALATYCKEQLQEKGALWPSEPLPATLGMSEDELRAYVHHEPLLEQAYQGAQVITS